MTRDTFDDLKAAAIPIAELMASPHGLAPMHAAIFKDALAVFYYDFTHPLDIDRMRVVHGRGNLQEVAHGSRQRGHVVCVAIDPASDELEMLVACCTVHRGGYDEESFQQSPE